MGHFTILLSDNRQGDVRWGKVRKLQLPFQWAKKNRTEKKGYLVSVDPSVDGITTYQLFKTSDGFWSLDPDGRNQVMDKTAIAIKEAIEQHEREAT
jgi:hypothetical protein